MKYNFNKIGLDQIQYLGTSYDTGNFKIKKNENIDI